MVFKTQRIVSLRKIRLDCITNYLADNSRKPSYFSQTNSILFSKAKRLREVNIPFTGYSIKQHDTVEYLGCQLDSKLSGETLASKILGKINYCKYRITMELYQNIHEIIKLSLLIYNTGSQMPLDIPLRKTNTGQERLSFFGLKAWSRINPSNKNVKQRLFSGML